MSGETSGFLSRADRVFLEDAQVLDLQMGEHILFYQSLTVKGPIPDAVVIQQAYQGIPLEGGALGGAEGLKKLKIIGKVGSQVHLITTSASIFMRGLIASGLRVETSGGNIKVIGDLTNAELKSCFGEIIVAGHVKNSLISTTSSAIKIEGRAEDSSIRTTRGEITVGVLAQGSRALSTMGNIMVKELQKGADIKVTEATVRVASVWSPQAAEAQIKIFGSRGLLEIGPQKL